MFCPSPPRCPARCSAPKTQKFQRCLRPVSIGNEICRQTEPITVLRRSRYFPAQPVARFDIHPVTVFSDCMTYFRCCYFFILWASWINFSQNAQAQEMPSGALVLSGTGTLDFDVPSQDEPVVFNTTVSTIGNITFNGGLIKLEGATNYVEMNGVTITNSGTLTLSLENPYQFWRNSELSAGIGPYNLLSGSSINLLELSPNGTSDNDLTITLLGKNSGFNDGTTVTVIAAPEPCSLELLVLATFCFLTLRKISPSSVNRPFCRRGVPIRTHSGIASSVE